MTIRFAFVLTFAQTDFMKAAVIHQMGTIPQYEDLATPMPADGQLLINVAASSLKQLDKSKVGGKHYTKYEHFPASVGFDGAGTLADGTRVYAMGITGMMAEQALIPAQGWVPVPENLDMAMAAALPNALLGSDAALVYRGKIQPGDTVLINGATGVSGQMAVQMARQRGAGYIIATGRNETILKQLLSMGADETVSLRQDDHVITEQLRELFHRNPMQIVADYLWGRPMERILEALKGTTHKVKIVTIGEMAGPTINLPSGLLRSSGIEILGSGIGSISRAQMIEYFATQLPELFRMAADGKLVMSLEKVPLRDVAEAWLLEPAPGARIVFTM